MTRHYVSHVEQRAIYVNLLSVFLMGLSGLVFGTIAHSSAVMLDGLFSSILFITVIIATFVKRIASKPKNDVYPQGQWLLENLYVLFKIIVLIAIVMYSLIEGISGLVRYFEGNLEVEVVNQSIMHIYYYIKAVLVVYSFIMYTYYLKKIKFHSSILKLERKSVLIDGGITIAIALGFLILSNFEATKDISDQIILTLLSIFLLYIVFKDFKHELNVTVGKRLEKEREDYYKGYFNHYFESFIINDVYIQFSGKIAIVSVTASFKGQKSISDISRMQSEIKHIMYEEYDEIFLNTYWDANDHKGIIL